jgi:hypothetical protein
MSVLSPIKPEVSQEEVDREVRAIFSNFARQFKDLPGVTAADRAHVYIARYIERYRNGHRAADDQS